MNVIQIHISVIEPSFDILLFQDFWRFAQICKKFAAYELKIVFAIVSEQVASLKMSSDKIR